MPQLRPQEAEFNEIWTGSGVIDRAELESALRCRARAHPGCRQLAVSFPHSNLQAFELREKASETSVTAGKCQSFAVCVRIVWGVKEHRLPSVSLL